MANAAGPKAEIRVRADRSLVFLDMVAYPSVSVVEQRQKNNRRSFDSLCFAPVAQDERALVSFETSLGSEARRVARFL